MRKERVIPRGKSFRRDVAKSAVVFEEREKKCRRRITSKESAARTGGKHFPPGWETEGGQRNHAWKHIDGGGKRAWEAEIDRAPVFKGTAWPGKKGEREVAGWK